MEEDEEDTKFYDLPDREYEDVQYPKYPDSDLVGFEQKTFHCYYFSQM